MTSILETTLEDLNKIKESKADTKMDIRMPKELKELIKSKNWKGKDINSLIIRELERQITILNKE